MASLFANRISNFLKFLKPTLRSFSVAANQSQINDSEAFDHIYAKRFTKKKALVDHLVENVIYNEGGIIVLNKPYGIGKKTTTIEEPKIPKNYRISTFETFNFSDVMDDLASKLGFKSLQIAKYSEKYCSGAVILAASDGARKIIEKAIRRLDGKPDYFDTFLVVTVGNPRKNSGEVRLALSKEDSKKTRIYLTTEWSKKSQKKHLVRMVNIRHNVLLSSKLASLTMVQTSCIRNHAIRLYMATKCFSPVLGDQLFGPRIKNFNGVPIDLGSQNPQSHAPLQLSDDILEALKLSKNQSSAVPAHIHLQTISLQVTKHSDLKFSAPPPESFLWTCRQLGLDIDQLLANDKCVITRR